ncbi:F-box/FBD/LRR-repeat protein At1g13570-like isoform X2 [Lycium barbarum]|uniref:F-box/FBD/LRR-repeat protein At1g13570-like isoform X2 n=1 Tax=Lycium barbarum TaxID=112863 RepID=UPI00293F3F48|nr:F-box/FBD/LRR-repeat protein At1g13570-like isoform X2 [Lycium barbarum]
MTQDGERAVVEGDSEDRISYLPRNVLDRILELIPLQDAARTSILSKNWRYIWATLPNLVLDYRLCRTLILESESNFKEAVDDILLLHMGDIMKFVLDTSGARLSSYAVIDRWVLYVTRNGVKKLTLQVSNFDTYTLPSSIFNCSTLTKLTLFKCVFKPPNSFLGFQNLITLYLQWTTFLPTTTTSFCVIKAPRLAKLTLNSCHGTQYLNIVSPGLKSLYVRDNHYYLFLNCFINCKNLRVFELELDDMVNNPKHDEKSTPEKLLVNLPALELLSAQVPNGLSFTLNCLWHLSLGVDFGKMGQIFYALQLIKSSPNLSKLDIWVDFTSNNAEAVSKNLNTLACLERPLDKLKYVDINGFESSEAEMLFVKLLLSRTPSLLTMCIDQYTDIDIDIALELKRFHRASPRAKLFY